MRGDQVVQRGFAARKRRRIHRHHRRDGRMIPSIHAFPRDAQSLRDQRADIVSPARIGAMLLDRPARVERVFQTNSRS